MLAKQVHLNTEVYLILNTFSADEDPNEHDDHQTHDSSSKLPDTKSDINTERTHIPTDSNNDISDDEIISLVLQECKKCDYKMIIIPIDIWDFGGQKIYYMTHQLFISSMGTYVVVFNGSIDINVEVDNLTFLPGHKGKKTSAGKDIDNTAESRYVKLG